jgi:hypothetical protein
MKQEKAQLRDRNAYLLDEIRSERNFGDVIGRVMVRETVMQEVSLISNFNSKTLRPIRTKVANHAGRRYRELLNSCAPSFIWV